MGNSTKIEWHNNQPYSTQFQDVYFSSENGLHETNYVFLQGNNLEARWRLLANDSFSIAETGFGTGLNFLCAVKLWLEIAPDHAKLNFISTEKYPLTLQDITAAMQLWPDLATISSEFLKNYEALMTGSQCLMFDQRVHLMLLIGDATSTLTAVTLTEVNAWFLDGFSPAKNPLMWQAALFEQMARLSGTSTTLATFTSAGSVRRGLTAVGFKVKKRLGYGKKREMLIGNFSC